MRIGRRNLRKGLVVVGCLLGAPTPAGLAAGLLSIAAGGALHFWSKGCLEQNRRLITAGPYRFVRNPFYLANGLIDAGLCLVIGRLWVALVFALLFWFAYRETIRAEERHLASLFPETYPRYLATVPRLLPNGSRWPAEAVTGAFRLDNAGLARGQEYARLIGIALGPAVVVAAAMIRDEGLALLAPDRAGARAFLVALPVVWVLKLALAEAFRRPEAALVARGVSAAGRRGLALGCALVALAVAGFAPALAVVAIGWCGLALVDEVAAQRVAPGVTRKRWRYRRPVVVGSVAASVALLLLFAVGAVG